MAISVAEAASALEGRGMLMRWKYRGDHWANLVEHMAGLLGAPIHPDLTDFYCERIGSIGDFLACPPTWNEWVSWRYGQPPWTMELLASKAVPIFGDGCGNLFGLDLSASDTTPAVYFFDHEDGFERPRYAAGSSLGAFLLLLADDDRAYEENWPAKWQLAIDPDLNTCPRAPAIWDAG